MIISGSQGDVVGAAAQGRPVQDATTTVLSAAGLAPEDALRVWVLLREQPDGTWGAGSPVIRYADLVDLAQQGTEQADA